MKVLTDQKPKFVRLSRDDIDALSKALKEHAARLSNTLPAKARHARVIRRSLPKHLPYELCVLPQEWEIISQALRPVGSNPPKGSEPAYWYALYQRLRRVCVFTTEGDLARLRRAKRQGFRRLGRM